MEERKQMLISYFLYGYIILILILNCIFGIILILIDKDVQNIPIGITILDELSNASDIFSAFFIIFSFIRIKNYKKNYDYLIFLFMIGKIILNILALIIINLNIYPRNIASVWFDGFTSLFLDFPLMFLLLSITLDKE